MEKLPKNLLDKFMNNEHVVHLTDVLSNGIWSDMAIETMYMKVGKGIPLLFKSIVLFM